MIDWKKLKPYANTTYRSYEELCYQIAKLQYDSLGRFTSIDDSGGGDGVEFYLTMPQGEEWGWQAKFYFPETRLSVSNRKNAIRDSLRRACEKHPSLTKWFLCTPTNFTQTEQQWFDNDLAEVVPTGRKVELIHWSESEFLSWISEPRFTGKRNYFFGELELSQEWFNLQAEKQLAGVKDKFTPNLHTESDVDDDIHALIIDEVYLQTMTQKVHQWEQQLIEFEQIRKKIQKGPRSVDWTRVTQEVVPVVAVMSTLLHDTARLVTDSLDLILSQSWQDLAYSELIRTQTIIQDKLMEIDNVIDEVITTFPVNANNHNDTNLAQIRVKIMDPYSFAADLLQSFIELSERFMLVQNRELHIFGDAGFGKTHITSNACFSRIKERKPAILVLARHFTGDRPIEEQLLRILDVPVTYSWNDFMSALDSAAEAYNTRIPIIIDGLNESTNNGAFSQIWTKGLAGFVKEIEKLNNIVLITTCRTTYVVEIWPTNKPQNVRYTRGFRGTDIEEAVQKYFDWYKIKGDITDVALSHFEHPLYLKIFCESKNPDRKIEKHIFIGEQSIYQVFSEYLKLCNQSICSKLGRRPNTQILKPSVEQVAAYMWSNKTRSISFDEFVVMVDKVPLIELDWNRSISKVLLDEGLLVSRDWRSIGEVVTFTYDLLGGYIISNWLINEHTAHMDTFFRSDEVTERLFNDDFSKHHPIYQDIARCIAAQLPETAGQFLHELSEHQRALTFSVQSMFEISPEYLNERAESLISHLFGLNANRIALLRLAFSSMGYVQHPFNGVFWGEQLQTLSMTERDSSWSEFIRNNAEMIEKFLQRFEKSCQKAEISKEEIQRLFLYASITKWMLTSSSRPLRDLSTKALYWYGRRYPEHFLNLLTKSFEVNDPYVSERMLAATYGISMARQNDFHDKSFVNDWLPSYGKAIYDAMFATQAPYATTHILARDYARRLIEIACIHHPNLLDADQIALTTPPYTVGGIRKWGQLDEDEENDKEGVDSAVQMDFGNYTLGRLVRNRRNYDFNNIEYKQVRSNLLWRIKQLGYNKAEFDEIDTEIANENWRFGRAQDGAKTDRYGKKYSWIAYFEIAGYLEDLNLLPNDFELHRVSDTDIDPSFPSSVKELNLIQSDFLGDRSLPFEEWLMNGETPDLEPYLVFNEILNVPGPWVLLDGYINQEDEEATRSRFIFPRGLLVPREDSTRAVECLNNQDLSGRWLPEIPGDYYTFAGEIPWCETFPDNEREQMHFINEAHQSVEVLVPVRVYNWESYHSSVNPGGENALVPCRQIASHLNLCSQPQTFDLYDSDGRRASYTLQYGTGIHKRQSLIYLRKDQLDRYLQETDQALIWAIWGEREFHTAKQDAQTYSKKHISFKAFQEIKLYE